MCIRDSLYISSLFKNKPLLQYKSPNKKRRNNLNFIFQRFSVPFYTFKYLISKFRTFSKTFSKSFEQMKLTVIYFPFSKRPKKVNRQKWETIFRKKRKGLNPTDIFPFVFQLLVSSFILIVPFKIKLQKQTQLNAFFLPFFFFSRIRFCASTQKKFEG